MKHLFKHTALPYLLVTTFCIVFSLAPSLWGNLILPRTEELSYSLYPLVMWSRQLMAGEVPLWFADGALGIPWPIPHTMSHTPLVALFALLPVYKALASLLAVHIAIQAFFTIRISQYFGLTRATTIVVLLSVLLAAPMEYLISSDAAAVYMSWTLLPVVLYALLRLLEPAPAAQTLGHVILLGAVVGYGVLNGHVGVFSTHILGLALIAVFQPRALLCRWYVFLLATLLALGIGAEKLYMLAEELPYFGKDTARLQYTFGQETYSIFWNLFLKPLVPTFSMFSDGYWNLFIEKNSMSRAFTFGSPLCAILLLCGFIRFLRGRALLDNASLERALWLTLATCFLIQFVPTKFLPVFISASWTFRDPAILIALFLAGVLCDRWLRQVMRPAHLSALMGIHTLLLLICATIFTFGPNWRSPIIGMHTELYNALSSNGEEFSLPRMIRESLKCTEDPARCSEMSKRVVYDGRAAYAAHRGSDAGVGLHLNSLPLHGLQEVSSLTKGLSLDAIHPSQSMPYGMITTLRFANYTYHPGAFDWVQKSPALLDLLGIRIVLGMDDPSYHAHGLERISIINPQEAKTENILVLYKNPRAYPRAFFVPDDLLLKVQADRQCPANATFLTCMDVSPITNNADPWRDPVHVQDRINGMILTFAPSNQPRTLLISNMFRPQWKAHGGELSSFHGLMRLTVPAQENSVTLDYVPTQLIAARVISVTCLTLTIIGLLVAFGFAHKWETFKGLSRKAKL